MIAVDQGKEWREWDWAGVELKGVFTLMVNSGLARWGALEANTAESLFEKLTLCYSVKGNWALACLPHRCEGNFLWSPMQDMQLSLENLYFPLINSVVMWGEVRGAVWGSGVCGCMCMVKMWIKTCSVMHHTGCLPGRSEKRDWAGVK